MLKLVWMIMLKFLFKLMMLKVILSCPTAKSDPGTQGTNKSKRAWIVINFCWGTSTILKMHMKYTLVQKSNTPTQLPFHGVQGVPIRRCCLLTLLYCDSRYLRSMKLFMLLSLKGHLETVPCTDRYSFFRCWVCLKSFVHFLGHFTYSAKTQIWFVIHHVLLLQVCATLSDDLGICKSQQLLKKDSRQELYRFNSSFWYLPWSLCFFFSKSTH